MGKLSAFLCAAAVILPQLLAFDSIAVKTGAWTPIGPATAVDGVTGYMEATAGRVTSIAPDPVDPNTLYAGTAGGGIWRTSDAGLTWTPVTDSQASLFIGAVAVAPSNRKVVYAGTGESTNGPSKETRELRFNIYSGRGILKSTDGGSTWSLQGTSVFNRRAISRIVIASNDPNVVYAAVGPRASDGLEGNTGVWKSTDGGANWTNTTQKISTSVPVTSLIIDPSNPQILYAAFGDPKGATANGVYKTTDAGATWNVVNLGGTQTRYGHIMMALQASNPQTVFVSIAQSSVTSNSLYGVFKTTNGGTSWRRLSLSVNDKFCPEFGNLDNILAVSGDYHHAIAVDPANASRVYLAGLCIIDSQDGGDTWALLATGESSGPHRDHHALAFDARGRLLDGNDGGLWRLEDLVNETWSNLNAGMETTQFQGLALHPTDSGIAVGGTQDNGTMLFQSSVQWSRSQRGDGGVTIIDPTRPLRVYQVIEEGPELFSRSLDGGNNFTLKRAVVPDVSSEVRLWYFPMVLDPSNGARLLIGTNRLWLSTDAGVTWNAITAPNQSGWTSSAPISAIAIAASNPQVVYAAAGGHLFLSANSGAATPTWITRDLPDVQSISALAVSPTDVNTLCAARDIYGPGQVFCSADGGKTWTAASGDLPQAPVLSLVVDPRTKPATMYAGTLSGVYVSTNSGAHWSVFGAGLPNSAVPALALQGDLLAAGTHGRGAWQILVDRGAAKPQITAGGVVVHAGISTTVSPGSLVDIYGTNLAPAEVTAVAGAWPTTLGSGQVLVNGAPAPVFYVSPGQVIFQVPYEAALGTASVVVTSSGAASTAGNITIAQAAPSILYYGNNHAIVQNPDASLNSAANPSKVGSTVVVYLIGSGPLDHPVPTGSPAPDSPLAQETLRTTVKVGSATAVVSFAGLTPRFQGLVQVNFQIPDLPAGDYPLQITIGSAQSNSPILSVSR